MTRISIPVFCLALLAINPVFAAKRSRMDRLDADRDGRISLSEFQAHKAKNGKNQEKRFRKLDINSDGYLSVDELANARAHHKK